ncbi:alpha/beta hydrolase [Dactylosporangium sp. CA-139066]|uniref:alpha/beta hydrolase n=1 Tax=Dactylosporangium sp. CA-139066 TaxID=3239930 RepID=UPI003D8A34F8
MSVQREKVRFISGGAECAAWHYPGTNGACVVMAGGLAVPKEPATDRFAERFHAAGFSVLAFDYRRLGESGGRPRLVLSARDQAADWRAAIGFARALPGVDPARIALWAFSASAGHAVRVAAGDPRLAAVVAQTPYVGGVAPTRVVSRHQRPAAMLRFTARGILDALGGLVGLRPRLVALAGPPGTVAMLTTPDALNGDRALEADRYPDWPRKVAARSALGMVFYRPGRFMAQVRSPMLVLVCDDDQSTAAGPTIAAARRAPHAEVVRMPGGHYEPFLDGHKHAAAVELAFLRRHLLGRAPQRTRQEPAPARRP